jgi:hypothetical protein
VFAREQDEEDRSPFLQNRATAQAEEVPNPKVDVKNKLNNLRRQEEQRQTESSIKYTLRNFSGGGVSTVTYKDATEHIVEADSK